MAELRIINWDDGTIVIPSEKLDVTSIISMLATLGFGVAIFPTYLVDGEIYYTDKSCFDKHREEA